eukprot:scaffold2636_cov20-Tisochrysis_lutea.AAC.2
MLHGNAYECTYLCQHREELKLMCLYTRVRLFDTVELGAALDPLPAQPPKSSGNNNKDGHQTKNRYVSIESPQQAATTAACREQEWAEEGMQPVLQPVIIMQPVIS